jgi:L-fuconolactonase
VRIDAHHHLWDVGRRDYDWLKTQDPQIQRTFDASDLQIAMASAAIDRTIVVQTVHELDETRDLLSMAAANPETIGGVVGWVDLVHPAVSDALAELMAGEAGSFLVGIRHVVHNEPDARWLMRADVRRGLQAVGEAGLAYELLVRTRELPAVIEIAESLPDVTFVLDHIGKPPMAKGAGDEWAELVSKLALHPNVSCKLSGLVTEAKHGATTADFRPYSDRILDTFGTDRIMFGSDWPVCLPYRSYEGVYELAVDLLQGLSASELAAAFGLNAVAVYGLA